MCKEMVLEDYKKSQRQTILMKKMVTKKLGALIEHIKESILLAYTLERRKGLLVLILVMGMAILETLGVASIMPFLAVLGNPEMIYTNTFLITIFDLAKNFGITTPDDFLVFWV